MTIHSFVHGPTFFPGTCTTCWINEVCQQNPYHAGSLHSFDQNNWIAFKSPSYRPARILRTMLNCNDTPELSHPICSCLIHVFFPQGVHRASFQGSVGACQSCLQVEVPMLHHLQLLQARIAQRTLNQSNHHRAPFDMAANTTIHPGKSFGILGRGQCMPHASWEFASKKPAFAARAI